MNAKIASRLVVFAEKFAQCPRYTRAPISRVLTSLRTRVQRRRRTIYWPQTSNHPRAHLKIAFPPVAAPFVVDGKAP